MLALTNNIEPLVLQYISECIANVLIKKVTILFLQLKTYTINIKRC